MVKKNRVDIFEWNGVSRMKFKDDIVKNISSDFISLFILLRMNKESTFKRLDRQIKLKLCRFLLT